MNKLLLPSPLGSLTSERRTFYVYLLAEGIPSMYNFSGSKYDFFFSLMKKEIEKRTKMKTCIDNSFPSKVRFRKKVHSQASDHVWFFLTYSQSVRAKKKKEKKRLPPVAVSPHLPTSTHLLSPISGSTSRSAYQPTYPAVTFPRRGSPRASLPPVPE